MLGVIQFFVNSPFGVLPSEGSQRVIPRTKPPRARQRISLLGSPNPKPSRQNICCDIEPPVSTFPDSQYTRDRRLKIRIGNSWCPTFVGNNRSQLDSVDKGLRDFDAFRAAMFNQSENDAAISM